MRGKAFRTRSLAGNQAALSRPEIEKREGR